MEKLDISNFNIENFENNNTNFEYAFGNQWHVTSTEVEITTNASTKTWLNTNFPSYTNIVLSST